MWSVAVHPLVEEKRRRKAADSLASLRIYLQVTSPGRSPRLVDDLYLHRGQLERTHAPVVRLLPLATTTSLPAHPLHHPRSTAPTEAEAAWTTPDPPWGHTRARPWTSSRRSPRRRRSTVPSVVPVDPSRRLPSERRGVEAPATTRFAPSSNSNSKGMRTKAMERATPDKKPQEAV